jgi:ATP-dependent exoDNAse (exonuclease V) alpha subunit
MAETRTFDTIAELDEIKPEDEQQLFIADADAINLNKPVSVDCSFVTGPAGSGKTYRAKEQVAEDPQWGVLTATTGIAAVNLNATTLNSTLKFFDTASLKDSYVQGRLASVFRRNLYGRYKNLVIDEISMMDGEQVDVIVRTMAALNEWNQERGKGSTMGLVLTGDFLQLPPVKAKWAFEAQSWDANFEPNTEVLSKIWRQDDPVFLDALALARRGDQQAAAMLPDAGAVFASALDQNFEGTTIFAKNDEVNRYNQLRLDQLPGQPFGIKSFRWGKSDGSWKNIPDVMALKDDALVMILFNGESNGVKYVNGDLGYLVRYVAGDTPASSYAEVRLQRGGVVKVPYITRDQMDSNPPERGKSADDYLHYSSYVTGIYDRDSMSWVYKDHPRFKELKAAGGVPTKVPNELMSPWGKPYYDPEVEKFVIGAVKYLPLRLAYGTTVHKSQGLSLDHVQIDPRAGFFGSPGMAYVALSRARTADGLRVIGTPTILGKRIKANEQLRRWM